MPSLPRADKLLVNAVWALLIAGGLGMCFGVLPPIGKRAIIEYAALVLGLYATSQALAHHFSESDAKLTALQRATDAKLAEAEQAKAAASAQERKFALATKQLDEEREAARQAFRTRAVGTPILLGLLNEYYASRDATVSRALEGKRHPAMKAAEIVRDETASRRLAEKTAKGARLLVEYYESIAPFLLDYKYERTEEEEREAEQWIREYSEEERTDPATRFLAKDEFLTLSSVERNQRALDRYWARPHYPDELGRMYERYVGYLAEADGYEVSYTGIMHGFEDLGRDLVCQRGNETRIIQCKYWSRHRTIHEKHIFQLFGSVCMYRIKNANAQVAPEFFTTTSLSDVARDVAMLLDVSIHENQILDQSYPVIKCNINPASRERIYHLPFDQQYDFTKIKRGTGELYCSTVAEAEGAGFRRAFRYRGLGDA